MKRRPFDMRRLVRCSSLKIGYPNYPKALDAAELAMLRDEASPGCHLTPYECEHCRDWHIANRRIIPVNITIRTLNEIRTFHRR